MIASSVMLRSSIRPAIRFARPLAESTWSGTRYPVSSAPFHSSRSSAKPSKVQEARPKDAVTAAKPASVIQTRVDPHQMASEFIRSSSDARPQGTEALASMTSEQKMRNYATAAALMAFVGWVWWYSMQSVGRSDGGFEDLQAEAEEARAAAESKSLSEMEAERLADLDVTMSNLDKTEEGEEIGDDVVIAVAAPDEIAQEEENHNLSAKGTGGSSGRPLWKKVVFFWRRE